jgi:hypothetical protein
MLAIVINESMFATNEVAIRIEALIRSYLTSEDYTDIDLVGVFFHEIMIYATNFYIISTSDEEYK